MYFSVFLLNFEFCFPLSMSTLTEHFLLLKPFSRFQWNIKINWKVKDDILSVQSIKMYVGRGYIAPHTYGADWLASRYSSFTPAIEGLKPIELGWLGKTQSQCKHFVTLNPAGNWLLTTWKTVELEVSLKGELVNCNWSTRFET